MVAAPVNRVDRRRWHVQLLAGLTAVAGATGLWLQLDVWKTAYGASSLVDFFSLFTTLANVAVLVSVSFALVRIDLGFLRWWRSPAVQGAVLLYIVVTFLVFALALSSTDGIPALAVISTYLLHYVVPAGFTAFWWLGVSKGSLERRNVVGWLAFPVVFLAWTLARGARVGWYPYWFLDPGEVGSGGVLATIVVLTLVFAALGTWIVELDRRIAARRVSPARASGSQGGRRRPGRG